MATKNIVFDFGNVIMKYDVDAMLGNFPLTDTEKQLFKEKIFDSPLWKDGDRGFGFRDVLFYDTVKELPEKLRDVFYALAARYDFESRYMSYNNGIEEMIRELKDNGYRIFLLSNIALSFHVLKSKVPAFGLFDGFFPSCDHGLIKPDKEVYNTFFRCFSLVPEECLFIDDSIDNVNASIEAGMPALLYNALYEDVLLLRKRLFENGITVGY